MGETANFQIRRPKTAGESLFLLGPGGVGKSTLGAAMARQSGWPLLDLDLQFCDRIQDITDFIAANGYPAYRAANLAMAKTLVAGITRPTIVVTPSGFLAAAADSEDYRDALRLVQTGYGITLLPSLDVEEATDIVVARQLTRGFGFEHASETTKFHRRFPIYRRHGDMLVVSTLPAERLASTVLDRLSG